MSASHYHELHPSLRVWKRVALNRCLRAVAETAQGSFDSFGYVTFGGEELYDLLDLLAVFDVREHEIAAFSFEERAEVFERARKCRIFRALNQLDNVKVSVSKRSFPRDVQSLQPLIELREGEQVPMVYYLDYLGVFKESEAAAVTELLTTYMLGPGDFLLLTACLVERYTHQTGFMDRWSDDFRYYFGNNAVIDRDFKVRNHVELLLAREFTRNRQTLRAHYGVGLRPVTLGKVKYRDSTLPMALWAFGIERADVAVPLVDLQFDQLPMTKAPVPKPEPDLLGSLFG